MKQVFLVPNFTKEGTLAVADQVVPSCSLWAFPCCAKKRRPAAWAPGPALPGDALRRMPGPLRPDPRFGGRWQHPAHCSRCGAAQLPGIGHQDGQHRLYERAGCPRAPLFGGPGPGRYTIDRRLMLDVSSPAGGECIYVATLLNDGMLYSDILEKTGAPAPPSAG